MSALFSAPKFPDPPTIEDDEVEEERRRQLALRTSGSRQQSIVSGGRGVSGPILGTAAQITGGL